MLGVIIGRHTWIDKYARTYIRVTHTYAHTKKSRKTRGKKGKSRKNPTNKKRGGQERKKEEKEKRQKEKRGEIGGK